MAKQSSKDKRARKTGPGRDRRRPQEEPLSGRVGEPDRKRPSKAEAAEHGQHAPGETPSQRDFLPIETLLRAPYFGWGIATGFAYYEGDWIPLLFELTIPARLFARGELEGDEHMPPGWEEFLRIPAAYANPPRGLEDYRFCTAWLRIKGLGPEQSEERNRLIHRLFPTDPEKPKNTIVNVQLGSPGTLPVATPVSGTMTPLIAHHAAGEVVTAVIDDGIAFAHERFRRSDGTTRFEYFWDQNGSGIPASSGFGLGQQWTGAQINAASGNGARDEDLVYQELGELDYSNDVHHAVGRRVSHGTAVCDLAFGLDPSTVAPARNPMLGVRLEDIATRDTSGHHLKLPVIDALLWILLRADDIAAAAGTGSMPVVATLSYGFIAGPHTGCSTFERAIEFILKLRNVVAPMRLVLPSGNWYLARCHAHQTLPAHGTIQEMRWRILPDDATGTFLEVWVEVPEHPPNVEVSLVDPANVPSKWVGMGQSDHAIDPQGQTIWSIWHPLVAPTTNRVGILIWVAPTTVTLTGIGGKAMSGSYLVRVREVGGRQCTVSAWVQRDDTPIGYPIRGRQSHFDDPAYSRYDLVTGRLAEDDNGSYVKRLGTINAIATSDGPIVVGGFRRSDRWIALFSAAGPALAGGCNTTRHGLDPDALAVTDDSPTLVGVLTSGTRSGSIVAMSGTSVAVPQIARLLWNELLAGRPGDRAFVQNTAQYEENTHLGYRQYVPDRIGYGRIATVPVMPGVPFPGAQQIMR